MADTSPRTSKVWKASRTSTAAIAVSEDTVAMVAGNNIVAVTDEGTTIAGPISLASDSMNIRKGGLFVGLNDFIEMIPSTIVTPLPKQIPFPPVHGVVGIVRHIAFFTSLLS